MAHFVAKELKLRPYDILTTWTPEELLVSFGEYANIRALSSWELMPKKERRGKVWTDRWAVLFVPLEEAIEMQNAPEGSDLNNIDLQNAADLLL